MENIKPEENVSQPEEIVVVKEKKRRNKAKKIEPEIILTDKVEPSISHTKAKLIVRQPRIQSEKQKEALANLIAKNKQRKLDRIEEEKRVLEEKLKEEAKVLKAYRVRPKKPHAKKKPMAKKEIEGKKTPMESDDENDDYDSGGETTDGTRVIRKTISKIAEIDNTINKSIQVNPYADLLKRYYA